MSSQGPNDAASAASIDNGLAVPWTNANLALSAGGGYATSGNGITTLGGIIPLTDSTVALEVKNPGFSIPSDPLGIVIEFSRHYTGGGSAADLALFLLKAGVEVGTDHAAFGWPLNNDAYQSYGSPTDLWGTTWTAAQINSSGFGVHLYAYNPDGDVATDVVVFVDHFRFTVYFAGGSQICLIGVGP